MAYRYIFSEVRKKTGYHNPTKTKKSAAQPKIEEPITRKGVYRGRERRCIVWS